MGAREAREYESGRMIVPSVWVEGLFRKASVEAPHSLNTSTDRFLVRGLGLNEFLSDALELLIEEGLLEDEDDDGMSTVVECADAEDLQRRADAKVMALKDEAILTVQASSFDWLNGFDDRNRNPGESPRDP